MDIPDAPWVQDPERYSADYYYGTYEDEYEYYYPEMSWDEPLAVYDPDN